MKSFKTIVLSICMLLAMAAVAQAARLGPASDYAQLLELADKAVDGDVILISGEIIADEHIPLSTQAAITLKSSSDSSATLRGLKLDGARITADDIRFEDSLSISGTSYIELGSGVTIKGADGRSGLTFDGNGVLILYPDCRVEGGAGSEGMTIRHRGGEFYAGIEGIISGGSGHTGGSGLTISQLSDSGTMMISGSILGGTGDTHGGQALNLYELSGNAFVTVTGSLTGGDGNVGGDGIQVISTNGNASVGIHGHVTGGKGQSYGGDALILMNMGGASSVNLSGSLTGGDAAESGARPGTSLLVVGSGSASRTRVGDCNLQDGKALADLNATPAPTPTAEPDVTPLPEITSSVEDADLLATPAPEETPTPEATAEPTPEPTAVPTPKPTVVPTPEPTPHPTPSPTPIPTQEDALEPTSEPTPELTASPEHGPETTAEPSAE